MCEASSLGDRGMRLLVVADNGCSFGGIVSDSPRICVDVLLGVVGLSNTVSSLDNRRGSRNAGDGERTGLGASERDRGFGVVEVD